MISSEITNRVALITLNRPEARNAINGALLAALGEAFTAAKHNPDVRVIILTGADPAFCAGLDLKDLGTVYDQMKFVGDGMPMRGLLPDVGLPVIGAINGAAVTGGLELALSCDFLIASHRATFADTHARVGMMPGGGMTIRLPQLVGINRARQMSLTGNFVDAGTAAEWGLVNEVVPHGALLSRAQELGEAIAEAEPHAVAELRAMYESLGHRGEHAAYLEEVKWSRRWRAEQFSDDAFNARRDDIIQRGSAQQ